MDSFLALPSQKLTACHAPESLDALQTKQVPFGAFPGLCSGAFELLVSGEDISNSDWNNLNTWRDVEIAIVTKI